MARTDRDRLCLALGLVGEARARFLELASIGPRDRVGRLPWSAPLEAFPRELVHTDEGAELVASIGDARAMLVAGRPSIVGCAVTCGTCGEGLRARGGCCAFCALAVLVGGAEELERELEELEEPRT